MPRETFSSCSFLGVPTYFRACCHEASRGGDIGYDHPGRELMRHAEGEEPYTADHDDWLDRCNSLYELIRQRDDRAVLQWFVDHFPRCMALVPRRRRQTFLRGVYSMAAELHICDFDDSGEEG